MDVHKNARSCPLSRELLCKRVLKSGWSLRRAAAAAGLSSRRAHEWVRRNENDEPMTDRSSRPRRTQAIDQSTSDLIVSLRRQRITFRRIAILAEVSVSTVARVCRRHDLSRLRSIEPPEPPRRYERDQPGELLHVDVKRLGRFDQIGHRITRRRSFGSGYQGWEFVWVATDDASRLTYAEILPNEHGYTAIVFLARAIIWFHRHHVSVARVMTDNGSAFVSHPFAAFCRSVDVRHLRTRPYTPRTNGKVERMIQTLLREWAYRFAYNSSKERQRWLAPYLHFYNVHRAHSALNYNPPISRLVKKNVLALNS